MQVITPRQTAHHTYVPALGHGWLTPCYDTVVRLATRERSFKTALIEQAQVDRGLTVLDLATGTGTLAVWMKQREPTATLIAVDVDQAVLAIARKKAASAGADVQFSRARSTELPFRSESFDRVVSSLFFHHLTWDDKVATAREAFRVLRNGGEMHLVDWGHPAGALMRAMFVAVQILDGFENTRDNVKGRLVPLLQGVGFVDVSTYRAFNTIFGTLRLSRATKRHGPS